MASTTDTTAAVSFDLDGAARACGLSRRELQRAIATGDLTAHYRGRKPLIRRDDLDEFVASLPTSLPTEQDA